MALKQLGKLSLRFCNNRILIVSFLTLLLTMSLSELYKIKTGNESWDEAALISLISLIIYCQH